MDFGELKETIERVDLVDAHAHNLVANDSSFPFISAFSEAADEALLFAPHSLSYKRSLREIAELYECENSLRAVEEYRRSNGLLAITLFTVLDIVLVVTSASGCADRYLVARRNEDWSWISRMIAN